LTSHPLPQNDPPDRPSGSADRPRRRPRRRWLAGAALGAACLAVAAGALALGSPGRASADIRIPAEDPTPYVIVVNGDAQATTTESPFGEPLHAQVYSDTGAPMAGVIVTFHIVTGGALTGTAAFPGDAQSADVVTGNNGDAVSPVLTAGDSVGYLEVTATVPGESHGATFDDLSVGYSPAAKINVISGGGQSALSGTDFAHPFVVQVLDAHGRPIRDDSKVSFHAEPSGPNPGTAAFAGGQTIATAGIGADGYATSPTLTAGSRAGTFTVTASVPQSPYLPEATFTGTTLPQVASAIELRAGNHQFASEGSAFPVELQARVLDQAGNPIPDPSADVTVSGPATVFGHSSVGLQGGPDGVVTFTLAATDDNGPVKVTVKAGTGSATFDENVAPDRGTITMTTTGDGQQTDPGQPFAAKLGVLIRDGDSRLIPDFPVTFTVNGPAAFADGSEAATVTSSSSGVTYAPPLHATKTAGPVLVTVTIHGTDAATVFHLEVGHVNGLLIVSGNKQMAKQSNLLGPLTPFQEPLTVEAIQSNGKPANGIHVTYSVSGAAWLKGADGLVNFDTDELTGTNGQASTTLYARHDKTGAATVAANAPGYGSVTFTEAVLSQ